MFGSEILDIAVGMVLVYLLLSLILTAVQETLEAWLKTRAANLERSLRELLQGDDALVERFYDHPLVYALHATPRSGSGDAAAAPKARPSYIPRETFAAALIDLVKTDPDKVSPELKRAFDGLNNLADGDLTKLRREIETWFDGAMDRASGWYKRKVHARLFWLGLGVALILNVNSVILGHHLAVDPQSREYANRLAENIAANPPGADREKLKAFQDQLEEVGLPIGWSNSDIVRIERSFPARPESPGWLYCLQWLGALLALIAGYAITALAVTMGAPFWFDLLNKFMVIRSTVKPTEKSPDEPSEDGGTAKPKAKR